MVDSGGGSSGGAGVGLGGGGPVGLRLPLANSSRAGLVLVLLCLIVYVPGQWTIPVIDRDEARFAQASRQMFESVALPVGQRDLDPEMGEHRGGLVVPMVGGKPRLNKPPMIYWVQSVSAGVMTLGDPMRDAIWMYRLPSLVASILTVLMTWGLGRSMFDARVAWLGAALLAVSPVFVWEAHQARADQVLVAFTTLAMWGLWETVRGGMRRGIGDAVKRSSLVWPMVLWVGVAGGVMTKGPITPMIVALCLGVITVSTRRWTLFVRTKPILGVLLVTGAVGPWVYAVAQRVGWDVYIRTIADETLGRAGSAMEGHWGPPGYHLALLAVLFWPGSLLTVLAFVRAFGRGVTSLPPVGGGTRALSFMHRLAAYRPGRGAEFFCLAWIIPSWIVFELVSTKLPHYTMPLFPPIALLSARGLLGAAAGSMPGASTRLAGLGHRIWLGIGVTICVAVPIAFTVLGCRQGSCGLYWSVLSIGSAMVALALLVLATVAVMGKRWIRVQAFGIGAALTLGVVMGVTLPGLDVAFVSPKIVAATKAVDPDRTRSVAILEYHEDSLVFLSRGSIEMIDGAEVSAWFGEHPGGLLWAPPSWLEDWAAQLDLGLSLYEPVTEVSGFNYSRGRSVVLRLYTGSP